MAVFDSSQSYFGVNDTGGDLRNLSDYIVSISGLPGPRELNDATAINDTGRKWHPGLQATTIRLELMWSDDGLIGPDTVLALLRIHTSAVSFYYGPEGNGVGDIQYTGTCWVRTFDITSRVGSLVMATAELVVEGTVGRSAF